MSPVAAATTIPFVHILSTFFWLVARAPHTAVELCFCSAFLFDLPLSPDYREISGRTKFIDNVRATRFRRLSRIESIKI